MDSEAVPSDNELSSLSVVVSNIEPGTTQLELASHFQLVGDIKKVIMSEDTREEAAHACITFKDAASAENALTLDGTPLGLSRIVVKRKCMMFPIRMPLLLRSLTYQFYTIIVIITSIIITKKAVVIFRLTYFFTIWPESSNQKCTLDYYLIKPCKSFELRWYIISIVF